MMRAAFEYYQAGNLDLAEQSCKKILKKQPNNMNVVYFLGMVYYQSQHYDAAIQYIEKFLKFNPTNHEAYYNLGRAYERKGETDKAISCYQKALKYKPTFLDAVINLGNLFHGKRQPDEALVYYRRATEINPEYAGAYYNIGVILQEKEQTNDAISAYKKAIQLNPDYADAYHDLGYALQMEGELDEAVRCYQKALQLKPELVDAYNNLGRALQGRGQFDDALIYYQKALQLNPAYPDAHWNIALINLLKGNYIEGWKGYEWRWRLESVCRRSFPKPLWDVSEIQGCTILLNTEQGFGDTIQFIRYASVVAQRGARVLVECQRELAALLRNVEGVSEVISKGEQLLEFDVHYPLLSLPLVFATTLETIPAEIPYLAVDPMVVKNWSDKIRQNDARLRIGLAWSGNPKNINLRYKSCSLDTFAPLAVFKDVTFYSLQKGEAATQIKNPPEGMEVIDYTEDIHDFLDTAGLIENLDLVISVDTSVAHLAGALGKPIWTLIPFSPDWRWMLNREDSPWYPTMRLFRQPSPGDWESVIHQIAGELKDLAGLPKRQR